MYNWASVTREDPLQETDRQMHLWPHVFSPELPYTANREWKYVPLIHATRKGPNMTDHEKTQPLLAQGANDIDQNLAEEQLSDVQGGGGVQKGMLTRSKSVPLEGRERRAEILKEKRELMRTNSDNMLIGKQPFPSYALGPGLRIPRRAPGSPAETWEGSDKVHPLF